MTVYDFTCIIPGAAENLHIVFDVGLRHISCLLPQILLTLQKGLALSLHNVKVYYL